MLIVGNLRSEKYINKNGVTVYSFKVYVEEVEFLNSLSGKNSNIETKNDTEEVFYNEESLKEK